MQQPIKRSPLAVCDPATIEKEDLIVMDYKNLYFFDSFRWF